jgi:hypothetical protein
MPAALPSGQYEKYTTSSHGNEKIFSVTDLTAGKTLKL